MNLVVKELSNKKWYINLQLLTVFIFTMGVLTSKTAISVIYWTLLLISVTVFYYNAILKKQKLKFPTSCWWLLGFCITIVLSLLVNDVAFNIKNYKIIIKLILSILAIGPFTTLFLYKDIGKYTKFLIHLFIISLIVSLIYGFNHQTYHDEYRNAGLVKSISGFAFPLAMVFPFFITGIFREYRKYIPNKWYMISYSALILIAVGAFIQNKTACLGILSGMPFVFLYKNKKIFYKLTILFSIISFLWVGFIFINKSNIYTKSVFYSLFNKNSFTSRVVVHKLAMYIFLENPMLGVGFGQFKDNSGRISKKYNISYNSSSFNTSSAHNLYLEILSTTGIIGLIVFLMWWIYWIKEVLKSELKYFYTPFFITCFVMGFADVIINPTEGRTCLLFFYSIYLSFLKNIE